MFIIMKLNIVIPLVLKAAFIEEIGHYKRNLKANNLSQAWFHLERSHVIGQSYPIEHSYSHWLMLLFGFKQRDGKEVLGQLLRLAVGGWKSFIDHVPKGNTGGSNVPPLLSLPIPDDIQALFQKADRVT